MRPILAVSLSIVGTLGLPGAGSARTVMLPEKQPVVSFELPDDWTVIPVAAGLELSAPDHSSVIEAGVVRRAKKDIVAWQKEATKRMKAFGITFNPNINPEPAVKNTKKDPTDIGHIFDLRKDQPTIEELPSWSLAPPLPHAEGSQAGTAPATDKPADRPSTNAASSESKPVDAKPVDAKPAEAKPAEAKAGQAGTRPHFRSLLLYGGVLGGNPIDVQFLDFSGTGPSAVVIQQASGSTDERAATIVNSIRLFK